jgi:hypothetical protein
VTDTEAIDYIVAARNDPTLDGDAIDEAVRFALESTNRKLNY